MKEEEVIEMLKYSLKFNYFYKKNLLNAAIIHERYNTTQPGLQHICYDTSENYTHEFLRKKIYQLNLQRRKRALSDRMFGEPVCLHWPTWYRHCVRQK